MIHRTMDNKLVGYMPASQVSAIMETAINEIKASFSTEFTGFKNSVDKLTATLQVDLMQNKSDIKAHGDAIATLRDGHEKQQTLLSNLIANQNILVTELPKLRESVGEKQEKLVERVGSLERHTKDAEIVYAKIDSLSRANLETNLLLKQIKEREEKRDQEAKERREFIKSFLVSASKKGGGVLLSGGLIGTLTALALQLLGQ